MAGSQSAPPPEYSSLMEHTVYYHRLDSLNVDSTTLESFKLGNFAFIGMFEMVNEESFTVRIQLSHATGQFPKPVRCMITLLDASGTDTEPYKDLLIQDKTYTTVDECARGLNSLNLLKRKALKQYGWKKPFTPKNWNTRSFLFKFEVMWG